MVDCVKIMWFFKILKIDKKLFCVMYLNLLYIVYFNKVFKYIIRVIFFVNYILYRYFIIYLYCLLLENLIIVLICVEKILFYFIVCFFFFLRIYIIKVIVLDVFVISECIWEWIVINCYF